MDSLQDLQTFYALLDRLEEKIGGKRRLVDCHGRMDWPARGVYFFFEPGELRSDSGTGLRVVRVGTHALKARAQTSLWNRLSQHRGAQKTGGGNHRGSIFRLIVGAAIMRRDGYKNPTSWGIGSDPSTAARRLGVERAVIRDSEATLEEEVSNYICDMPFLWLDIGDAPGPDSLRGVIERNSIALLSNYRRESLDSPSSTWLGNFSNRERVRDSGTWNSNHVDESYDPRFLATLQRLIEV
jgi:hypothetical protein